MQPKLPAPPFGEPELREKLLLVFLTIPDEQMYTEVLDLLLAYFQSDFGLFGFLDDTGDLVCPSMTYDIFQQRQVADKAITFPQTSWGGLWGQILRDKQTLFKNEAHPTLTGHLPVQRSLGAPLVYRGTLIGLIQLTNRPSDYTSLDAAALEKITQLIAPVLNARLERDRQEKQRHQAEAEIHRLNADLERRVAERTAQLEAEIAQRRQTEATLHQSNRIFHQIAEHLPDIIWVSDVGLPRVSFISPVVEKITGYSPQVCYDDPGQLFRITHPDDQEQVQAFFQQPPYLEREVEHRIVRPNGSLRWLHTRAFPVRADDGTVVQLVGITSDITKRKQAETELETYRHHLEALVRQRTAELEALNRQLRREITERQQTEAALRESEHKFATIFRASPDIAGIGALSDGRYIDVNDAFVQLTGYSREEAIGRTSVELGIWVDPADRARLVQRLQQGETVRNFETSLRMKDGRTISVLASVELVELAGEKVLLTFVRDISKRKQMEAALRDSEERLRLIIENMPVLLDAFDADGHIIFWNHECERVTGYSAQEIVGQPQAMARLYPDPAYLQGMMARWQAYQDDYYNREWNIVCKDGQVRTITWSNISSRAPIPGWATWGIGVDVTERQQAEAALQQAYNELERRVAERTAELVQANQQLHLEITERIRAEQALRESEARHRMISNIASDYFYVLKVQADGMFIVEWINGQAFQRITGYPTELLDDAEKWMAAVNPDDLPTLFQATQAWLCNQPFVAEYRLRTARGEERWLRDQTRPIWDEAQQRVVRIFGAVQDITERKRVEGELDGYRSHLEELVRQRTVELETTNLQLQQEIVERQQTQAQLRASLAEKEVLLKEIHHRVKNNLQVISSLLDLQAGYVTEPKVQELFKESQRRVKSMAFIHERLYQSHDLARIEFAEYVDRLLADLRASFGIEAGQIVVRSQLTPVALSIATAIPCGLIINELVSNAMKHAFPNGRSGEIWVKLATMADHSFVLTVKDNGIGLPAEIDFRRANSLGLTLVITLVSQLKGEVELVTEAGTEFKVTFVEPKAKIVA